MRHRKQSRGTEPGQPRPDLVKESAAVFVPEVGGHFIGPSGQIWTVQAMAHQARRVVLTRPTDDGPAGMVVDLEALAMMVSFDRLTLDRMTALVPGTGASPEPSPRRWTAPRIAHVLARHPQSDRNCHRRRRVLVHLAFDESHHAHVDTYESMPA